MLTVIRAWICQRLLPQEPVPPLPSRLRCPGCGRRWDKIYVDGRNCTCGNSH